MVYEDFRTNEKTDVGNMANRSESLKLLSHLGKPANFRK